MKAIEDCNKCCDSPDLTHDDQMALFKSITATHDSKKLLKLILVWCANCKFIHNFGYQEIDK